ncbi:hypothetical protein SLNWT_3392 [Streptomyces albus]|uniref:Uncharacterized protein n=1 Tax=Streptomyces albus (strain ATCC 21838 / DSM 41398 / FERM P-419 / JCM 4703 / NBRC 107858) TaxID=1081613 RepID=A0A0B5EMQ0_STRA4|nr:hypothetical protein SLNWT_3392 [Streptomyces albus]AOU78074.1 hypothetical protein SLNHY_3383 [Streptomyces albus]AYN33828.1 hypothetical protein DUI70_3328 [Streptomyces albus]
MRVHGGENRPVDDSSEAFSRKVLQTVSVRFCSRLCGMSEESGTRKSGQGAAAARGGPRARGWAVGDVA